MSVIEIDSVNGSATAQPLSQETLKAVVKGGQPLEDWAKAEVKFPRSKASASLHARLIDTGGGVTDVINDDDEILIDVYFDFHGAIWTYVCGFLCWDVQLHSTEFGVDSVDLNEALGVKDFRQELIACKHMYGDWGYVYNQFKIPAGLLHKKNCGGHNYEVRVQVQMENNCGQTGNIVGFVNLGDILVFDAQI